MDDRIDALAHTILGAYADGRGPLSEWHADWDEMTSEFMRLTGEYDINPVEYAYKWLYDMSHGTTN